MDFFRYIITLYYSSLLLLLLFLSLLFTYLHAQAGALLGRIDPNNGSTYTILIIVSMIIILTKYNTYNDSHDNTIDDNGHNSSNANNTQ